MHASTRLTLLKNLVCTAAIGALVASCAPLDKAAPPVATLTLPKKANLKQLEEGRQVYAGSCTHCHGPARVDRHGSTERWTQKIMPRMCAKSNLTAEQSVAVTAYVMAARKSLGAQ